MTIWKYENGGWSGPIREKLCEDEGDYILRDPLTGNPPNKHTYKQTKTSP